MGCECLATRIIASVISEWPTRTPPNRPGRWERDFTSITRVVEEWAGVEVRGYLAARPRDLRLGLLLRLKDTGD